jgi:hypothetical protein
MKIMMLAVSCALAFPTVGFAKTAHTKIVPTHVRKIPPSIDDPRNAFILRSAVVLRQDLFDRNDRNNVRSDWPAPPAQPGQF